MLLSPRVSNTYKACVLLLQFYPCVLQVFVVLTRLEAAQIILLMTALIQAGSWDIAASSATPNVTKLLSSLKVCYWTVVVVASNFDCWQTKLLEFPPVRYWCFFCLSNRVRTKRYASDTISNAIFNHPIFLDSRLQSYLPFCCVLNFVQYSPKCTMKCFSSC